MNGTLQLENANGVLLSGLFIQKQHVDKSVRNGEELPARDYVYISTGVNQYRVNATNNPDMLNALSDDSVFMGIHMTLLVNVSMYNNNVYFIQPRLVELGGKIYSPYDGTDLF